jgi:hypothetical protein
MKISKKRLMEKTKTIFIRNKLLWHFQRKLKKEKKFVKVSISPTGYEGAKNMLAEGNLMTLQPLKNRL